MSFNFIRILLDSLESIRSTKWKRHILEILSTGASATLLVAAYIFEKDASEEFEKDGADNDLEYIRNTSVPVEEPAVEQAYKDIQETIEG